MRVRRSRPTSRAYPGLFAPRRRLGAGQASDADGAARAKKRSALMPLAATLAGLPVLIGGGAWWFVSANRPAAGASNAPTEAARLSIVVLPFANLSNDPAQDYFADGVTENLTTELSRLHNSFVIARNTASTFKGKNLDAKAIGKDLGVRYVLEGSVQRDANRVRVNAQLIDAESGAHLWADRFDEDVADLFKLEDDVVARLASALQVELVSAEAQRSLHDRPRNPDAIADDARFGASQPNHNESLRRDREWRQATGPERLDNLAIAYACCEWIPDNYVGVKRWDRKRQI
jgi:adenylate cyclase